VILKYILQNGIWGNFIKAIVIKTKTIRYMEYKFLVQNARNTT